MKIYRFTDMRLLEFPRVLKKEHVKIPGVNYISGIPMGVQEKLMRNLNGS